MLTLEIYIMQQVSLFSLLKLTSPIPLNHSFNTCSLKAIILKGLYSLYFKTFLILLFNNYTLFSSN